MPQVETPESHSIPYATPAARPPSRLGPAVWIAIIGLALIGFGGCFLIGIMVTLIPQFAFGTSATPTRLSAGLVLFLAVLYGAAIGCFAGAGVLLFKGVKLLFGLVTS